VTRRVSRHAFYNEPAEVRSFETFAVHMHLVRLYLLHAELTRDGADFRYHRKDNPGLLVKVDGEPKRWELAQCIAHRLPKPDDPIRLNIEFFIDSATRSSIGTHVSDISHSLTG
jgi:hypothetical protein